MKLDDVVGTYSFVSFSLQLNFSWDKRKIVKTFDTSSGDRGLFRWFYDIYELRVLGNCRMSSRKTLFSTYSNKPKISDFIPKIFPTKVKMFFRLFTADSDTTEQPEVTQDILTCGSCQKTFALSDIVKFIQHKVLQCNKENYGQCFSQGNLLQCATVASSLFISSLLFVLSLQLSWFK